MKFELEKFHRDVSEEDLLADLKATHQILSTKGISFSYRSYAELGKYSSGTISARFGSWNRALIAAGIAPTEEKNVTNHELFLNLEKVWESLGRQPVTRDMVKPDSKYSSTTYLVRFGGWRQALKQFVEYINQAEEKPEPAKPDAPGQTVDVALKIRRTKRNISDRMRFRVLSRDGFTCQTCGASPIKERGVELHVDHVVPWSKGGETEESNLSTKCIKYNLGKGNAFSE